MHRNTVICQLAILNFLYTTYILHRKCLHFFCLKYVTHFYLKHKFRRQCH